MSNADFWEDGEIYKFRVYDSISNQFLIYTGAVIIQDSQRIKLSDLKGREVTILKAEIKRSVKI